MQGQVAAEENATMTNGISIATLYETIDAVKSMPALTGFRGALDCRHRTHGGPTRAN